MRLLKDDALYGSVLVIHPDGTPMFRCAKNRAGWYLKRNLAKLLPDGTVQLLFVPKGRGHSGEAFYLEEKESVCVACGADKELTKHHCVPYCYRRFFPTQVKTRDHHDIVLLCDSCHQTYERHALPLKKELAEKCSDPLCWGTVNRDLARAKARASAISWHELGKHNIPEERLKQLREELTVYLGHDPTKEDIEYLSSADLMTGIKPHGSKVVEANAENLQGFIQMWRQHFLATMNPKYLSPHWQVERPYRQT